jgi:hypothetical protein
VVCPLRSIPPETACSNNRCNRVEVAPRWCMQITEFVFQNQLTIG